MYVEHIDGARGNQPARGPEAASERAKSPANRQPMTPSKAESQDTLSLSDRAQELKATLKAIQTAPVVREDKIADLRRRIDEGIYQASTEALVQDILRRGL